MSSAQGRAGPEVDTGSFCATTMFVKRVAQARHARSGVAGLFSWNGPVKPASFRAAVTASLIAKNTELPKNNVGSPIPFEE